MIQYANIFYFITNDIYLVQLIRTTNMNPQFLQQFFCLFTFWVFLQGNWFFIFNALSFYVTKTVLVGPKWFWSDQIDLDLTNQNCFGHIEGQGIKDKKPVTL